MFHFQFQDQTSFNLYTSKLRNIRSTHINAHDRDILLVFIESSSSIFSDNCQISMNLD